MSAFRALTSKNIFIERQASLLAALKQMDEEQVKLLIVVDQDKFFSMLSVGDIQRAIIANKPLETKVTDVLRKKIRVAFADEPFEVVRERMLEFRTECMPVVDEDSNLVRIHFWDEVFLDKGQRRQDRLDLPVVIMAGGKGSRLRPITNIIPKALVPLGDRPIMEIIMDRFHEMGVRHFLASVNYKAEMIQFYFSSQGSKDYTLDYISEDQPLGTAGGLRLMAPKLKRTFFVSNCDILVDQDYREIYDYHRENSNTITVVAALHHLLIPYGIMHSEENGRLRQMEEKPEITYKINTGMYVMEPGVLDLIPEGQEFHVTELIDKVRLSGGTVGVFPVSEKSWMDIGQWSEYQKTIRQFESRFQSQE